VRAAFLLFVTACGDPGDRPEERPPPRDLFPIAVGATWTYRVTSFDQRLEKTQSVTGTMELGGAGEVSILETTRPGALTRSYQKDTGDEVVRYLEESFTGINNTPAGREQYAPYKLRVAKWLYQEGATLTEQYHETSSDAAGAVSDVDKVEDWLVEGVETVVVEEGPSWPGAIRMHRTSRTTASDKTYWFVEGIGKVKEQGSDQTEELLSYSFP
jgi:hypothetical protein